MEAVSKRGSSGMNAGAPTGGKRANKNRCERARAHVHSWTPEELHLEGQTAVQPTAFQD